MIIIKSIIKTYLKIFFLSLSFILIIDFIFGKKILNIISPNITQYYDHKIYHHDLKKNINIENEWEPGKKYNTCTDSNGFRISCNSKELNNKNFDIAFIGDSFTEGVGIEYEKTFVGLISKNKSNLKIANLGVTSYSPSIYLVKFQELLKNNYKFKRLIIYIDISDIYDEGKKYRIHNDRIYTMKNIYLENFQNFISKSFPLTSTSVKNLKNNLTSPFETKVKVMKWNDCTYLEKCYERANWTYNDNKFEKFAINKSLATVEKIYQLAKENNIKISIGIYPWPGMLLYDSENSKQVKIWKEFCNNRCEFFFNNFPEFYDYSKKHSPKETIQKFYMQGDVHFNADGHAIIANNFIKIFKN